MLATSRPSIQERYQAGLRDVKQALAAQPWLTPKPEPLKALIHRVEGGRVATQQDANLKGTGEAAPNRMRRSTANAAAFGAVDM